MLDRFFPPSPQPGDEYELADFIQKYPDNALELLEQCANDKSLKMRSRRHWKRLYLLMKSGNYTDPFGK